MNRKIISAMKVSNLRLTKKKTPQVDCDREGEDDGESESDSCCKFVRVRPNWDDMMEIDVFSDGEKRDQGCEMWKGEERKLK